MKLGFNFQSILALTIAALMGTGAIAQQIYKTDQGHTEVFFKWNHAGVVDQYGEFTRANGTLTLFPDNIEASALEAIIETSSVASGFAPMDRMLKSARLLDVEQYPQITFKSTSIEQTGDATALITGDLTIHGVTKPTILEATLTFRGSHPLQRYLPDIYSGEWLAFEAKGRIPNHTVFGVGSSSTIGSKWWIDIEIRTELKRQ